MGLISGARLGSYEIRSALGVGGMGEVYRATDTKLKREVAIKVLPAALASDPDRLARFQREAEVLASLNHPHIAALYGLEEAGGIKALVMELVEGPTLADCIARGAIPISEALPIARQITEALEAAHEHGIVHRDLKPANIKVRDDGTVKVLDFGLAKALEPPGAVTPSVSQSPTITSPAMTRAGVILGTAAYMSPEQAKGKTVDKRTDIWSFGCVLYELLAGRRAFAGDDVAELIVAVLTQEPDWSALPSATPLRVVDLLKRCVRKNARERLHDIADARLELQETIARGSWDPASESSGSSARVMAATRRERLAWLIAVAALVTAGLSLSGVWPRARLPDTRPLRVSLLPSEGREVGAPAISPDGRRVAYAARRLDGMPVLWVRDLASGDVRALAGTEDARVPFWSPDSRELGFGTGRHLKRVPADGGPVQVLTRKSATFGGTWAVDGTIVVNNTDLTPLYRVSAAGGTATPVTRLQGRDWSHFWPTFLPDGRRFLFTAKQWTRAAEAGEQGIYIGSLDNMEVRRLLPDPSSVVYAPPGFLVFVRGGVLTAAPFDLAAGRVTGSPTPIGGRVAIDDYSYFSAVSASADGTLAVRPPPSVALTRTGTSNTELRLVDRAGRVDRISPAQQFSSFMALAPDGHRVAASMVDSRTGTQDLWLVDLQSGDKLPVTTTRGYAGLPVWSPDGTRLAYVYQPPGQFGDVYIKELSSGNVTPAIQSPADEYPVAWSHDGASLLFWNDFEERGGLSVWPFESRTPTRFDEAAAWAPSFFSPDDAYVAFTSEETGRAEVVVTTFPQRRQTWPLTTEGGYVLSWRSDGREILVATLSGHIAAFPVSTSGGFSAGQPTVLVRDVGVAAQFSTATRDHSKILIRVSPDAGEDKGEIQLLFGWTATWGAGRR